ncbi:pinensin family lanthipeptide [Longimicrobium sp.]|uniref:pinensin family lanthipeptide n=1 Tax=Longimicrobium sp. TaxID=2029185 RepID=UPI002E369896|nr:pinensin family lanthipeptide [Longimicrobium sp.]HEX6038523.1 pinensin family lanthipeptide [Longimicrobium sp.]
MKKLILDEIRVESFSTTLAETANPGTVQGHATTFVYCSDCNCNTLNTCEGPSCQYGTCDPRLCNTESLGNETCDYTCGDNYGCGTVDPRCTYGGVYAC